MPRLSVQWLRGTAFVYTLVAFAGALERICSPISHFDVEDNSRLTGAVFDTVISSGVVTCAKECLSRLACKSFNFQVDNGTCELNSDDGPNTNGTVALLGVNRFVFSPSQIWPQGILGACKGHNCPLNTRCVELRTNVSRCVVTYCSHRPAVQGTIATSPVSHVTPVNQSLQMECIVGYVPCGNVTCKPDGTWTHMTCMRLSQCKHVLELNSNYNDGEYWLYPQPLNGDLVKVYCHDMKNTPREYITLITPYFMDAPLIANYHCTGQDAFVEKDSLGKHLFSKFGLDVQNVAIYKTDYKFYNKTGVNKAEVGHVRDCYSRNCGPVGRAVIDLRGTGLSIINDVTWTKYAGWDPIVNRSLGGQLVDIRCGGYCGGCRVDGSLSLSLMKSDTPAENSATIPQCP